MGRQVFDTTTNQVKVKTDAATATYVIVGGGVNKAQGNYSGDASGAKVVSLTFVPDLVLISSNVSDFAWIHRSEAAPYQGLQNISTSRNNFTISGASFQVPTSFNVTGNTYYWTAFKFGV
jgi:hypothetical protein